MSHGLPPVLASKSPYAKKWVTGGTVAQLLLALLGFIPIASCKAAIPAAYWVEGSWTSREFAVGASLLALLMAAWKMHTWDEKGHGFGVRDVYRRSNAAHRTDDNVISGVLARESIQGAITLGFLGALVSDVELPSFREFITDPQLVFRATIAIVLGVSVVTTLAGILCYDYSSRFQWRHDAIRNSLISRGHNLGQWGFYSLMWSLAALPVLKNYYLAMFAILVVFWVMWYYYFFPVEHVTATLPEYKAPDMSGADLHGKILNGLNLKSVDLSGADLTSASLQRAHLSYVSLKNAILQKAQLQDAILSHVILTGANLKGADLSKAEITQAQIDDAKGDASTKLPEGIAMPETWK